MTDEFFKMRDELVKTKGQLQDIKDQLDLALQLIARQDSQLDLAIKDNADLKKQLSDMEKTQKDQTANLTAWKNNESKRKYRWGLIGFGVGIVIGLVAGIAVK